jgi:hypothetical protein
MRYTAAMPEYANSLHLVNRYLRTGCGRAGVFLLGSVLLAGCSSTPETPQRPDAVSETARPEPQSQVEQLLALAARADAGEAAGYLLNAARLLWAQGDAAGAEEVLNFIAIDELTAIQMEGILLLQAEVAAAKGEHGDVLALLRESRFPTLERLSTAQKIRFHELRAAAFLNNGAALISALERIKLDTLLAPEVQADNHEQIWQALTSLPAEQLQALSSTAVNFEIRGWYELARIGRTWSDDLDRQLIELRRWSAGWARHPAARIPPREIELAEILARQRPQRLALLLPLATPAGIIVRDAFMSAYFNAQEIGGQVPAVRFYDTGTGSDVRELHRQAREDGAQMIIGPLYKQQVAILQGEPDLGVPTLALNNVEGLVPASPQLYQFALAPEDEARQLANKAWNDGHRRVAILSPLDSAGNDFYARKRDSFIGEWQRLGGRIVAQDIYRDDYTDTIADLLELTASTARMESLRELIGRPLLFVQRRRQDIDFIYLISEPGPARQIVPSLAYLYAGDIPVYASQDVYSGVPRPMEDRDINGITFADSPWLLGSTVNNADRTRQLFPMQSAQNLRLQAFGLDAYRLYPRLPLLESSPDSQIPGASGILRMGPNRNIERELSWATITEGMARTTARQGASQ